MTRRLLMIITLRLLQLTNSKLFFKLNKLWLYRCKLLHQLLVR